MRQRSRLCAMQCSNATGEVRVRELVRRIGTTTDDARVVERSGGLDDLLPTLAQSAIVRSMISRPMRVSRESSRDRQGHMRLERPCARLRLARLRLLPPAPARWLRRDPLRAGACRPRSRYTLAALGRPSGGSVTSEVASTIASCASCVEASAVEVPVQLARARVPVPNRRPPPSQPSIASPMTAIASTWSSAR